MPTSRPKFVQVVPVGDELLRGETEDLNSTWIAKRLSEVGVTLDRICVVHDDHEAIADELREGLNFVTGGLGPTHDDVTAEAIADALSIPLEIDEEALSFIEELSDVDEHRRMALMPEGGRMLINDVGVAPGFVVEKGGIQVVALPGPPEEMRSVFQQAMSRLDLRSDSDGDYAEEVFVKSSEGEIVHLLDELVNRFSTVTVGSYPGREGVRIRFSGDRGDVEEAIQWLETRL